MLPKKDQDLLARFHSGEAEPLIRRYASTIRAAIHQVLGNHCPGTDGYQDIVQDIYARLNETPPEQIRSLSGFLFWIAKRCAHDAKQRGRKPLPPTPHVFPDNPTPSELLERKEDDVIIQKALQDKLAPRALARLQQDEKEIILHTECDQIPLMEAAKIMGRTYSAARCLKARAWKSFCRAFKELQGETQASQEGT